MRKIAVTLVVVLSMATGSVSAGDIWKLFGCNRGIEGSGDMETQTRDVKPFSRIKSTGSFDIFVKIGGEQSVTVTFDDNLIEFVSTRVRGKTLQIESEESFSSRRGCRIEITVPELTSVHLSGSGDVEVIDLNQEFFEYSVSGSGDLRAEGKVQEIEIKVSGSGDIDSRDLEAVDAYVRVSGSGDVRVYATESLDAHVSGSGDIAYYGDPKDVSRHVSGSGSIRKRK